MHMKSLTYSSLAGTPNLRQRVEETYQQFLVSNGNTSELVGLGHTDAALDVLAKRGILFDTLISFLTHLHCLILLVFIHALNNSVLFQATGKNCSMLRAKNDYQIMF